MPVFTRLHPLLHPVTAAVVLLLAGLLAGYALLLVAVGGAAAGFANSGST